MYYKKTFWMNVALATLFLLGAAVAVNPYATNHPSLLNYLLFMYLSIAFVLTAITIKKNNTGKLIWIALFLNYLNIPLMLFNLINGGNVMNVFYLGMPSILNLIALHSIKNNSKAGFQDITQGIINFIKSNFR